MPHLDMLVWATKSTQGQALYWFRSMGVMLAYEIIGKVA